jgi:serine/threonine protein kinase
MLASVKGGPKTEAPQRVQFGNFDIINDAEGRPMALGKGTFGRTYQARHRFLDTIVALKIINERYASDASVRQRFLVEARAVARLSHPHIARLYDFGEVDGVLHYAMEYCGGGSLAQYVATNGPLTAEQVVEIGQQIAGALKCAHGAGFIHRDLKPSNIMLMEPKGPFLSKLIDFGLVQPSLPDATKSMADASADGVRFLGTPLFASPEQLKEEPLDVRTDLFSLGMTLWYLLIGRAPDSGSSAEVAARRLSPTSYAGQLPPDLEPQVRDILARLLEKNRSARLASAAETLTAFNACASALGLRRTRDYTSATEGPEWAEPEVRPVPPPPKVATVGAVEFEKVEADLESEFKIVTRVNDEFTGSNYAAESVAEAGKKIFLHVLHPALVEDEATFQLLRVHMSELKALNAPEILEPRALRGYSDYATIIIERPETPDLLSVLRAERVVPLAEAAPLLETIATVCDRATAAGLPSPQLGPAYIFVTWLENSEGQKLRDAQPRLFPRFLAAREAPELARLNEPEDVSSTMTSDTLGDPSRADNVCEHFGTLLYRIVAGRNCPIAASLSSQAYVAVPGLSEQGNRLLSLVIAKQIERASCGQILREILGHEGISLRSAGQASTGSTLSATGSTVAPSLRTPPMSASGSTATSSKFRRLPVAPSAVPTPVAPPPLPKKEMTEAIGSFRSKSVEPPSIPKVTPEPPPPPVVAPPAPVVAPEKPAVPEAKAIPPPPPPIVSAPEPVAATPEPVIAAAPEPVVAAAPEPAVTTAKIETPPAVAEEPPIPVVAKAPIETKAKEPVSTPSKKQAKKSKPLIAKAPPVEIAEKKEEKPAQHSVTPVPLIPPQVPIHSAVEKKVAAPISAPQFPKAAAAPVVVVPRESFVRGVVPWAMKNIKPIGIGIAALLVASLAYGVTAKMRSSPSVKPSPITKNEPAVKPAENIVPAAPPAISPPKSTSDASGKLAENKQEAKPVEDSKAEQKPADDTKAAEEKAANDARLAAEQKAAEDAKLLAEQQKNTSQPGPSIPPAQPETAANNKAPATQKTQTQKQTQKDSQSSRNQAPSNRTTQSTTRSAPAPAPKQPAAPKTNNPPQRSRSEFGPTAPGG